ncbi:MAG TPA: polysaccharide deacetylase family protein [Lacunisphaera sp.]|nr:polysaccharide deacetylase family protein [Lacunisphaera sp.]
MRLDRIISLALLPPLRLVPGPTVPSRLPVLMYHSISDDNESGLSPYYRVCTSPRRFAEHMQWLADWGYSGVTLTRGLAALHSERPGNGQVGASNPDKLVAITFDDGFRDFHTHAFPVLRRHGFAASMYLPTAFIGEERKAFKARECLTWTEVKQMRSDGMEFGSHTVNHPELVRLGWPEIEQELRQSKETMEEQLEVPVDTFAYPYAFPVTDAEFTRRFQECLQQSGYTTCATTVIGRVKPGDNPWHLRRLPVNSIDDHALFEAKLRGAYDWLAGPQNAVKFLKRFLGRS